MKNNQIPLAVNGFNFSFENQEININNALFKCGLVL